ncbi:hypothetical protein [Bradyrhizobium sp. HKCCYLRH1030]|uniref:hypothetical protein n=1 Tax=Bradyrhizobium sp. HKCCYLRH1030 TaxID=3420744 RepID=UPI003EBCFC2E
MTAPREAFVIFMPWVTLPKAVKVGRFRFSPINVEQLDTIVADKMVTEVRSALSCYIGRNGKPIESCTMLLRARHNEAWNIPRDHWKHATDASKLLALSTLSEQRFFEGHFSPHMNSTMFRIVGQGIIEGSDQISPIFPRRSGTLKIGGLRHKDIFFQRPTQIEGTQCGYTNETLLKALQTARESKSVAADAIVSSLDPFLLANAEAVDLDTDSCVMLSAISFERMLQPNSGAQSLAQAVSQHWYPFCGKTISAAKRVKPDPNYAHEQANWPLHRKWAKELYELRSSIVHKGRNSKFSQNWSSPQHLIIAAFTYPLLVKLRLAEEAFYSLSDRELGACEALDQLLDSDWGEGWRRPPEWSRILSIAEEASARRWSIRRSIDQVNKSNAGQ